MHEASIAQSIVQTVLREAEKADAVAVESVEIEVGDLTFLGIDQVEFWVKTSFQGTLAEKAEIIFRQIPGELACSDCGYDGALTLREDPAYHLQLPAFSCPKCGGSNIRITQGREATIRRIKIQKK